MSDQLPSDDRRPPDLGWASVRTRLPSHPTPAASRRGRTNRSRGNAIERDWCHRLGLRLTGKYGDVADGDNAMFIGQCKSRATAAFPGWMSDELVKLDGLRSGKTAILGIVEAPGPGKRARRLVVVDEADWIALHVGEGEP